MCCTININIKIILFVLLVAAVTACSHGPKQVTPSISVSRESELSPQDRMRLQALERYRKMRENMWNQYVQRNNNSKKSSVKKSKTIPTSIPKSSDSITPAIEEEIQIENSQTGEDKAIIQETTPETPEPPKVSPEKMAERNMISEQLISYQCIKRRLNEEGCQELTSMLHEACPMNVPVPDPITCIKKNLKQLK
jgi:hypothetical protein